MCVLLTRNYFIILPIDDNIIDQYSITKHTSTWILKQRWRVKKRIPRFLFKQNESRALISLLKCLSKTKKLKYLFIYLRAASVPFLSFSIACHIRMDHWCWCYALSPRFSQSLDTCTHFFVIARNVSIPAKCSFRSYSTWAICFSNIQMYKKKSSSRLFYYIPCHRYVRTNPNECRPTNAHACNGAASPKLRRIWNIHNHRRKTISGIPNYSKDSHAFGS